VLIGSAIWASAGACSYLPFALLAVAGGAAVRFGKVPCPVGTANQPATARLGMTRLLASSAVPSIYACISSAFPDPTMARVAAVSGFAAALAVIVTGSCDGLLHWPTDTIANGSQARAIHRSRLLFRIADGLAAAGVVGLAVFAAGGIHFTHAWIVLFSALAGMFAASLAGRVLSGAVAAGALPSINAELARSLCEFCTSVVGCSAGFILAYLAR
jgi:hypothetical protein